MFYFVSILWHSHKGIHGAIIFLTDYNYSLGANKERNMATET